MGVSFERGTPAPKACGGARPALRSGVFGPLKKLEFGELVAIHGAGASRDTGREGEGEGERE